MQPFMPRLREAEAASERTRALVVAAQDTLLNGGGNDDDGQYPWCVSWRSDIGHELVAKRDMPEGATVFVERPVAAATARTGGPQALRGEMAAVAIALLQLPHQSHAKLLQAAKVGTAAQDLREWAHGVQVALSREENSDGSARPMHALEDIIWAVGVATINTHGATNTSRVGRQQWSFGRRGVVSILASLMTHDCEPCAVVSVAPEECGSAITLRTRREVSAGESLTISYVDQKAPRDERQRQLQRQHGFRCECARCTREASEAAAASSADELDEHSEVGAASRRACEAADARSESCATSGASPIKEGRAGSPVIEVVRASAAHVGAVEDLSAPVGAAATLAAAALTSAALAPAPAPAVAEVPTTDALLPNGGEACTANAPHPTAIDMPDEAPPSAADNARSWSVSPVFNPLHVFHEVALLSPSESAAIIAAAEALDRWRLRGAYAGNVTCDIDASMLADAALVEGRCIPLLAQTFRVPAAALRLTDLRVVKYTADDPHTAGLPLHSDGSALSFVCALNRCASGGGTYVRALRRVISPTPGRALLFCGRWLHSGVGIAHGVRYVLTGFVGLADQPPATPGATSSQSFSSAAYALHKLDLLRDHERCATLARRLCPGQRCWLRREFATQQGGAPPAQPDGDGCPGEGTTTGEGAACREEAAGHEAVAALRRCSRCAAVVPPHEPRHCCGCGVAWCCECLEELSSAEAAEAVRRAELADAQLPEVAPEDEEPPLFWERPRDLTVPPGSVVAPGARLRKVWRARVRSGEGGPLRSLQGVPLADWPRLARVDMDTDERVGSHCLGDGAVAQSCDGDDGEVDVAVELVAPHHAGRFRIFFRLVAGPADDAPHVDGVSELCAEFVVASRAGQVGS